MGMTLAQLEESMTARELIEHYAEMRLTAEEQERAARKARRG
jgi:hypothetical protein